MDDTVLNKLKEAISKGQVDDFILGKSGFGFSNRLIETPTDLDTIFLHGFNKYAVSKEYKEYLHQIITSTLLELTKSPIGLWWCIFFIFDYYLGFKENALKFSFDAKSVIEQVNNVIPLYREELKARKDFVGYRFKNGLWENAQNMIHKLNSKLSEFKIQA